VLRRGLLVTTAMALLWGGFAAVAPSASAATHRAASVHQAAGARSHTSPGARIVAVAKRYVGKARYRNGGASPRQGFDCSGYTMYAYVKAGVARLPHNTEAQRHARGMRRISASRARPGDLVFYLSGGSAYHVAIYAGHHMQYAAATSKDGIRYQQVYSRNVVYATDWH
jgi:cell wall-associated NlpC family hydrolase